MWLNWIQIFVGIAWEDKNIQFSHVWNCHPKGLTRIKPKTNSDVPSSGEWWCLSKTFTFTYKQPSNLYTYGAFTPDVKVVLNENLGGILGGTLC
jgi:hypothetical protein